VRQEPGSEVLAVYIGWALEADNLFRIAVLQQVRPVATVDPVVVCQAGGARLINGLTVGTLGIISLAGAVGENAKGVLTYSLAQRNHVSHTFTTVHSPVVVAVVMNSSLAVEKETILTLFLRQRSVSTLVELVAAAGVRIQLETFPLWALIVLLGGGKSQ